MTIFIEVIADAINIGRNHRYEIGAILTVVSLTTGVANSKTITVWANGKGNYPTIQATIDAANPGVGPYRADITPQTDANLGDKRMRRRIQHSGDTA